jgi:hypothetical protein
VVSDLAQRYGTRSPLRRPLIVAAVAVVAAAGLAWLVWAMVFHSRPQAQSQLLSFHVAGEHAAAARFTVVRQDRAVRASCLLRAYAEDHTVVGELNVPVGPPAPARTTLERSVRTERLATTVELVGCTTAEQQQPR